jgi:hypothetical protein
MLGSPLTGRSNSAPDESRLTPICSGLVCSGGRESETRPSVAFSGTDHG